MADGLVQVQPDSSGKKIDTSELTVGANTVERQRVCLADSAAAANIASVAAVGGDADSGAICLAVEGFSMVFSGSTWERQRSATIGSNVAATGIGAGAMYGAFNSTLPTITTGNMTILQANTKGVLYVDHNYINGTAIVTAAAGVQKVGITGNANATLDATLGSALPTNALAVTHVPNTAAAASCTSKILNAAGAASAVKASAGALYGLSLINNNAATVFVEFFDAASVTLGTTTPVAVFVIPASGVLNIAPGAFGVYRFGTQIQVAAVTAYNGSTTGSVTGTVFYL